MKHVVFTFPGQGGYRYSVLRDLYVNFPAFQTLFSKADAIAVEKLGYRFLPLVRAENKDVHDAYKARFPDLDQLGTYLANVLIAKIHLRNHIKPEILVGHSFGEIAALAVAGVYSEEEGASIVCDRIAAYQYSRESGKMAAISCNMDSARRLLNECCKDIYIAVQNHDKQTVVAGTKKDLEELQLPAAARGVSLTFIESGYPFHSPLLGASVQPFYETLKSYEFKQARYPVYLCTENRLYEDGADLAAILSSGFVKPLNFKRAVDNLVQSGFRYFIECGSNGVLSAIIRKNIPKPSPPGVYVYSTCTKNQDLAEGLHALYSNLGLEYKGIEEPPVEDVGAAAVAIISMGSVLPGSAGVEHFWRNIVEGVDSIVDLGALTPTLREDILEGTHGDPVPDKTYTLLSGSVPTVAWNEELLSGYYDEEVFGRLCKAEKMLAYAVAECIQAVDDPRKIPASRIKCFLGSTAEGIAELSFARYLEALEKEMRVLDPALPGGQKTELSRILESEAFDPRDLSPHALCSRVLDTVFNKNIETVLVDTACSSSAYATCLAVKALAGRECDLVLAGGMYGPVPVAHAPFAQFGVLSPTDSTPFDEKADGVVFADGAAIVAMKRLEDALKAGDKIIGVLRGVGISSDGKSPSIQVPRTLGQKLAIERAMENAGISIDTMQYFEAHATATPVGDRVEASSLREIVGTRDKNLPAIELGGVKALIGHTAMASFTASLLKIIKAFEEGTVPKQGKFSAANKRLKLEESGLSIATENKPWLRNVNGLPKRAGINSFGFGGTNAHVIVESYEAAYHARLISKTNPENPDDTKQVIVGMGFLYPSDESLYQEAPSDRKKFDRTRIRLPANKTLLPDIVETMDPSQFLSSLAAEKILGALEGKWERFRDKIGVVIGLESEIERLVWARPRLLASQMKRLASADTEFAHKAVLLQAIENLNQNFPKSTPYTTPGLLPNITASRVSSLFDLQGPNMMIDTGKNSFMHALETASRLLRAGDSEMVIAGGVNCWADPDTNEAEAACLIGLTTMGMARKFGMNVICEMRIEPEDPGKESQGRFPEPLFNYRGASQGPDMQMAIVNASRDGEILIVKKTGENNFRAGHRPEACLSN